MKVQVRPYSIIALSHITLSTFRCWQVAHVHTNLACFPCNRYDECRYDYNYYDYNYYDYNYYDYSYYDYNYYDYSAE